MENFDDILNPASQEEPEDISQQPAAEPVADTQEPVQEPVSQPQQEQPVYAERDLSRRRSPYADSPFESAVPPTSPKAPKARKEKKEKHTGRGWGGRILAAALAVVLVCGACGITAWQVNGRWEEQYADLQAQMHAMQSYLEGLIEQNKPGTTGSSVSGSPVSSEGLTPAQVYAQNVDTVGSITTDVGSGTGFVISSDGYVLSNYHVVEGAKRITMTMSDGTELPLALVGYYAQGDVALLKAEAQNLQHVTLGSSDALIVGDMVVAIGNPLGELAFTQTVGYVSGKDRLVTTDGSSNNMIQVDAAVNPGNSGGPLFNMKGEVVGIISAKYSGTTSSGASIEGLGFAIPIDDVQKVLGDLMEHGYVTGQAYLGVMTGTFETNMGGIGCYIESTVPGGAADRAGIKAGDILIAIDGHEVKSLEELTALLTKYKAGQTVTVTVLRSWREMQMTLTFDEKPQS